jgi:hypothetical protein
MGTAGPAARDEGTPEIAMSLVAEVTELIEIDPPPTFCRPIVCETACPGEVMNETTLLVTENCGAAVVTLTETLIF